MIWKIRQWLALRLIGKRWFIANVPPGDFRWVAASDRAVADPVDGVFIAPAPMKNGTWRRGESGE